MQSVFKGRLQNWQRKLSKDKNKKSWLCVSQELITPCWFWAEERWLEMVSRDGVKGGTGLHSLVTTSSLAELGEVSLWDRSGRKGMSPAKSRGKGEHIVFRGWSWSVWLHVTSKHQSPTSSQFLCFPSTSHSDVHACFCLPASLSSRSQGKNAARVPATVLDGTWKWLRIWVNVVITCQSSWHDCMESSSLQLWKYS